MENWAHLYGRNEAKIKRLKVTDKMRKHFPSCDCNTYEVHEYYDGFYVFHRPKCKWLMYDRKRKPRERLAWRSA